jgi:hypothetical protein
VLSNIDMTNLNREVVAKKPITTEEAKKWFDKQKTSSQNASNADSSLFDANPLWTAATTGFSQSGSEFLVAPLNLTLTGGRCVPRLLIRRNPNGELSGRYLLYIPDENYHTQTNGVQNPNSFAGAVIYTDFYGHYLHGYKIVNGQVVGTATTIKTDGRGISHLRSCISVTFCRPIFVFSDTECFDVLICWGNGGTWTAPGGWTDSPGGDYTGSGNSGSGQGSGTGGGSTWGSNQPPIDMGELSSEARQFLISKGFSEFQMDWLSTRPNLLNQILNYMRTDGSVEGALVSRKHT